MPRTNPDFKPMSGAERKRRYRERLKEDPEKLAEYQAREAERKAAWYAANKEKKAEAQRRYRQAKREQMLLDLVKKGHE